MNVAHDRSGFGAARAPDTGNNNAGCRAGAAAAGWRGRAGRRRLPELLAVLADDGDCRFEPDADAAALVHESALRGDPSNNILGRQDRPPGWRVVDHGREVCHF